MKNNSAQETLISMLQCFKNPIHSLKGQHGFNKFNMKDSELESEDNHMPELFTAPHFLRAKHTYSRLNKTTAWMNDKKRDPQNNDFQGFFINAIEEPEHKTVFDGHNNSSEVQTAQDKEAYPVEESEPSQSSLDSNSTNTSFNTGSSVENESSCSVCEDGNEDGSPGSNVLYTPPTGILLRDPMLGAFPTAWKKRFSIRPKLPETPVRKVDTLILSPSLLTSPSQGLKHYLLPEGQETLQTLFEDVWVTPESTILKGPRLSCRVTNESTMKSAGRACMSSEKKKGNKSSEDENSTPEKDVLLKKERKACAHRHTGRRPKAQTQAPSSKKKCVNGFIMFCRMNRKVYIRSHPGTPSTTVTKELANLWHVMPKQERRLYCLKAWRFSCQNNRNVRAVAHEPETEADDPSPLHRLLAHRDLYCDIKRRSSQFI